MNRRIGIQAIDDREQLALRDVSRQVDRKRAHAGSIRCFALVAHVDLRRGMLAGQHHREPRRGPAARDARIHGRLDPAGQSFGDGLAVENAGSH